jgi:hypothetical protein
MAAEQPTPQPAPVEYREVPGFPGYRIGNDGSVLGLNGQRLHPWNSGRGRRYPTVHLRRGDRSVHTYVHRLVAAAFIGPCPEGKEVCHNDNDGCNNRPGNLRYDTRSGNLADRDRHGTHQRGERNPAARLTNAQADEMRRLRTSGQSLKALAAHFGVRESTVSRIVNGLRRKEVERG